MRRQIIAFFAITGMIAGLACPTFATEIEDIGILTDTETVTQPAESSIAAGAKDRLQEILDAKNNNGNLDELEEVPEVYLQDVYTDDLLQSTERYSRIISETSNMGMSINGNRFIITYYLDTSGIDYDKQAIWAQMRDLFYKSVAEQKPELTEFKELAKALGVTHPENVSLVYIYRDAQGNIMFQEELGGNNQVTFTSDDWKSGEISFDGNIVKLPSTYAELRMKTGFEFVDESAFQTEMLPGYRSTAIVISPDGSKLQLHLTNPGEENCTYDQCRIDGFQAKFQDAGDVSPYFDIILPNSISQLSSIDEITTIMGEEPAERTEKDGKTVLTYKGTIEIEDTTETQVSSTEEETTDEAETNDTAEEADGTTETTETDEETATTITQEVQLTFTCMGGTVCGIEYKITR